MASTTKVDVKYFVVISGHCIYVKDDSPSGAILTKFSTDRKEFTKERAEKVAEEYGFDILEVTINTTIDITEKIIPRDVKK
jgi:hypothetical protein